MLVNVIGKCIKPMLACTFHFISYFYLPLKSCNLNYINLLLLIKKIMFVLDIVITNLPPTSMVSVKAQKSYKS